MNKDCLVYQPGGLGDILFIQKICRSYLDQGYRIIFPVLYEYAWLPDYIKDIEFPSWQDKDKLLTHLDTPHGFSKDVVFDHIDYYSASNPTILEGEFVYLNFFSPPKGKVMDHKYNMVGMDYSNWQDYVIFDRNKEKENKLFYEVLKIKDGEPYCLVSQNYRVRNKSARQLNISTNLRTIHLDFYDGYSLFDWCKVLENCAEMHLVETSTNYILESPLVRENFIKNCKSMNLYHRSSNFNEVRHLFSLPWTYK